MKAADFLADMQDEWFPRQVGPWIGIDAHDPPYTMTQLKQMEKQNVIQFDKERANYRLTLKASALIEDKHHGKD
jgi:hypothetical protein